MPFTVPPGAISILLVQAPVQCGSAVAPPPVPPAEAAVVQRDDAFVIVPIAAVPAAQQVSAAPKPVPVSLGNTVRIDHDLLTTDSLQHAGATR